MVAARLPDKWWLFLTSVLTDVGNSVLTPPQRVQFTTIRIVRDTAAARVLKIIYGYYCQICGERIELGSGAFYAEVHHIRPLGGPH